MNVSIILPTYNRDYIVADAAQSALAQTFPHFELLVVDDGSTDKTSDVVGSLRDDRVRYIRHEQNRGLSAALNTGISAAKGELVALLDSDDLWTPTKLEQQVEFLRCHRKVDAVFSDIQLQEGPNLMPSLMQFMKCFPQLLDQSRDQREYVFTARQMYLCLLEEVPIKPTTFVVRQNVFERVGRFDEAWLSGMDWEFFLRLSRSSSFGYIDRALAVQRRTLDATHLLYREQDKLFLAKLFKQERMALHNDRQALCAVRRGLLSHYNNLAWHYLHSGRRAKSVATYLQGFMNTKAVIMLPRALSALMPVRLRDSLRTVIKSA